MDKSNVAQLHPKDKEQKEYLESKVEDKVVNLEGDKIKGTYEFEAPSVTEQVEKTKEKENKEEKLKQLVLEILK